MNNNNNQNQNYNSNNNNNNNSINNNRFSNNLNTLAKKDYLSNLNSNSNNSSNNNNNPRLNNISQNIQNSSANKNNNSSNSNNSNSKITFNNNYSGKNKNRPNMPGFRPLSDSRLFEMANQYITTDESLEKFQARLKTKYGSLYTANASNLGTNLHVINEARSPVSNTHRENNGALMNEIVHGTSGNGNREGNGSGFNGNAAKGKRVDRLAKNIASNLEYYKMIESWIFLEKTF